MITTVFLATDLGIADAVIAQITTQLANATNPDPITDSINRQIQVVSDYTLRYTMPDERVKRLVRPLVMWDLFSSPAMGSSPPPGADNAYKAAMKELQDIRDGKFHDLQLADPQDPTLAGPAAGWGSKHKVSFDRGDHGCDGGEG
jgi:hypothetical protein